MEFKAAIFDMDGTLVDSLGFWDILWAHFGKRYRNDPAFRPTEADDKAVRTLILKDAMELIYERYAMGASGQELFEVTDELIRDFYSHRLKAKPGVKEFLEHCQAQGTKMCVASATRRELVELAMAHCGLDQYFCKLFSCADLGVGKDQPDVYLAAQKFLGSPIEDTWVFEDSAVAIQTADRIGMKTVGIYDKYNFGQDIIAQTATVYIAEGEDLTKLI